MTAHCWQGTIGHPPITGPTGPFDWSAVTDSYEPGDPIGYGHTEQEAVVDLLEQIADLLEQLE